MSDFFRTPIGAQPAFGLLGELPGPVYRDAAGNLFQMYEQAQPRGLLEDYAPQTPLRGGGNMTTTRDYKGTAQQPDYLSALLGGIMQGVTAPGRAARGEPVTYGDAWATALDYGGITNLGTAPSGALRGGTIRAYHGSPHDFDRFSLDKIGTGEGAQAYGHGLYFAEAEDVARFYRDALSTGRRGVDAPKFKSIGGELRGVSPDVAHDIAEGGLSALNKRIAEVQSVIGDKKSYDQHVRFFGAEDAERALQYWKDELASLETLRQTGDTSTIQGRMYEVQINADPDDFLDWDKPLSEQSPKVREALRGFLDPIYGDGFFDDFAAAGNDINDIHKNFDDTTPEQLTAALLGQGVPGTKYLDAGSRRAGDGSRNFVVFDDKLIEILRKYGLLPAAPAMGLLAQDDGT